MGYESERKSFIVVRVLDNGPVKVSGEQPSFQTNSVEKQSFLKPDDHNVCHAPNYKRRRYSVDP